MSLIKSQDSSQRGFVILEALIGILLFSIGALGLIAMYSNAISKTADAQYRMEATHHANQLMNQIWIHTDRSSSGQASPLSLEPFNYNSGGTYDPVAGTCAFTGGGTNPVITEWLSHVTSPDSGLPGVTAQSVSVVVNTAALRRITITICWQTPKDIEEGRFRSHQLVGNIS